MCKSYIYEWALYVWISYMSESYIWVRWYINHMSDWYEWLFFTQQQIFRSLQTTFTYLVSPNSLQSQILKISKMRFSWLKLILVCDDDTLNVSYEVSICTNLLISYTIYTITSQLLLSRNCDTLCVKSEIVIFFFFLSLYIYL